MRTQLEKARIFRSLHENRGAFLVPNPWDVGSARLLECLGFEALATTSAGFAQALGRWDGEVSLDEKLAHCRALCSATDVPVSADLENGFSHDPNAVAETIVRAAEAGLAGGSIEDYSGDSKAPIYELSLAVERIHAAVEAARSLDFPFTLTARAENQLREQNSLDDTLERLRAFEAAGADVLYAPGLTSLEEVRTVCAAVSKPVNVLATMLPGVSLSELEQAGARRISVGAALARTSLVPLVAAAREMLENGSFEWTAAMPPGPLIRRALRR